MKRLIAALLSAVMVLSMPPVAFAVDSEATEAADALHELGLFQGTGTDANGNPIYDLDRAPSRTEAVVMLVRLLGKEDEAKAGTWETPFTDVDEWAKPYIGYAYTNGLTSGTGATTFGGSAPMSATQYITLVLRALGYESGADFQWDKAWELSDRIGLTDGSYNAGNNSGFLRGDVAIISADALYTMLKDQGITLLQSLDIEKVPLEVGNIHYLYDIRTFTLYAFMNYTGYDDNNRRPITGVRADLAAIDLDLSSPEYFRKKNVEDRYYSMALECMGGAPDFSYLASNSGTQKLGDLPKKLAEFYEAADIPALYDKYRPDYEAVLDDYQESNKYIAAMLDYFRMTPEDVAAEFGIEVNLLDAFERGSGLGPTDAYLGYGVIHTGPSNEVNHLNILHEYAHGFSDTMVKAHPTQVNALSKYYEPNSIAIQREHYHGWNEIVRESFVRAFSGYFTEGWGEDYIDNDTAKGFTMTRYIYDRIPEFETFDGDLEAFIVLLV